MTTRLSYHGSTLTQGEVREILQYVPLFSGKTFILIIDEALVMHEQILAELLLDLISLQRIGVKIMLVYTGREQDRLLDWVAEVELKLSEATFTQSLEVMARGQAALVSGVELSNLVSEINVLQEQGGRFHKVIYIGSQASLSPHWKGALHEADARAALPLIGASIVEQVLLGVVESGVHRVHLLDGTMPGCLSLELFSNEGVGVMIYNDSYKDIRPLAVEGIPELLAIIGRPVRSHRLLRRTYEEIERKLTDYYVMTFDENVVGSVALHDYQEGMCELACLFVKGSHKGLGYGQELVLFAERRAKELGYKVIFALSTEASSFFTEQLRYQQVPVNCLPKQRQEKLQASGRESVALMKHL